MSTRRLLCPRGASGLQSLLTKPAASRRHGLRLASSSSTAPATIANASFWKSLVPKPLRRENRPSLRGLLTREWNPATFFIVIFLLIGSMSIQMIALRNSFDRYMRQSDVKIARLREVVQRIQNGENVDVEAMLGTGDPKKEADWEEVLHAIEREETQRKPQKQAKTKQPEAVEAVGPRASDSAAQADPKPKTTSLGNFF